MKIKETELIVEGMTCANCALSVRKTLEKKGLQKVDIRFQDNLVRFQNAETISLEEIKKDIRKSGYKVSEKTEENILKSKRNTNKTYYLFLLTLPFTIPLFFAMFFPKDSFIHNPWLHFSLSIPVLSIGLIHYGKGALGSIKSGVANMDVLILSGALAAFLYSCYGLFFTPFPEKYLFFETTATIITLVMLGGVIEHWALKKTNSAIQDLAKFEDEIFTIVTPKGNIRKKAKDILVNDIIQLNQGDTSPCDGIIFNGSASVDESMLTGESLSIEKSTNDSILSGSVLIHGNCQLKVLKKNSESTLAKIINLMKDAEAERAPMQLLADKVSAWFVPIVGGIALLGFFLNFYILQVGLESSILRSIAVLVISCPCALGLATPTAIVVGIGKAVKKGILFRSAKVLEIFSDVETILFDKTGTLTSGEFKIDTIKIENDKYSLNTVNNIIYTLEQHSSHPIAKSVLKELKDNSTNLNIFKNITEKASFGISAFDDEENEWKLGSHRFVDDKNNLEDFNLFLIKNKEIIAKIRLRDSLKSDAKTTIETLKKKINSIFILSGDKKEIVKKIADQLHIGYKGELLPEDKLNNIRTYKNKGIVAMVGDGINDAPALKLADIGISFQKANDIATYSSDILLMKSDKIGQIDEALHISKLTLKTIKQNLFWAFSYNLIAIPMALFGFVNPMYAAIFMAFSDLMVVGNSLLLKVKK